MHQSSKEKTMTNPEQRLLCCGFAESIALEPAMTDVEVDGSHSSMQEKLRQTPRKTYR
jgi:hypothetical protein